jgi:dihydroorotase
MNLTLTSPLDMHLHLRDETMLENVVAYTSGSFSGAMVMPNLLPPVTTKEQVKSYNSRIKAACGDAAFEPYMTLFLKEPLSYAFLEEIREFVVAIKLYPSGVTTNSDTGLASIDTEQLRPTLEAMGELGIPLSIHGETNGFVMDREREFMPIFEELAATFPRLKVIMEHISSKEAIATLAKFDNLYATVTVHHLLMTLDDVIGGMLKPHSFCKPILKTPADRDAIQAAVLSGNKKIMFGSDSAPHSKAKKESESGSAGIFSAPVALQALAGFFDRHGRLDLMQAFVSDHARKIYGINPPEKKVVLEKKPYIVPALCGGVVPLFAGETLPFTLVK